MKDQNEMKKKVVLSLIDRGVFKTSDNPRVTKFQGGYYHLKSDNDHGKAKVVENTIEFDTVKFGSGKTEFIVKRHSENPEVQNLITELGIEQEKMDTTIFVYDRKTKEVKKFEMNKTFSEMNNGIKAMQVQRIQYQINENDLILNTNLDRYIKAV